jgi:hypothetical protein
MMTVTQTERLVRKITEVIGQPASDTQAKLAQEYADLCRAASRRLEQCALMIEAGQFLQALQLAETPPPLLDVITVLSFRQAAEWRNHCQSHQLPWSEPFYDKYVRLLNSAYGKGIASDHPFYRDYRRAVMKNDDPHALSILRVIARMNPADENTREELKRMEEKLLRVKLEKLREVVVARDSAGINDALAQIEASGAPIPSSHPVWQEAQVARCQEILRRAGQFRQQGAWREAEPLVEDAHNLATYYNLQLPAADADAWSALEAWTAENRAAYANDQDFQRALSALEYEVQTIEATRGKAGRPSPVEAKSRFNSLAAKWSEAERYGHPLDAALEARYQQCQDWLQKQMQAADRKRRIVIGAVIVLILGAIGASIPSMLDWAGERNSLQRLGMLESSRRVADTEAFVAQIPPRLKTKPRVTEAVAEAQSFIAHETELKRAFDGSMIALQQLAASNFQNNIAQVGSRRSQTEHALAEVAPEFQSAGKSALMAWDAKWQSVRNVALAGQLNRAEEIAAALNGTNGYDAVHAALPRIQSILAAMEPLQTEPPELDRNLENRIRQLSAKAALWTTNGERWERAQASLVNAQSLDEYLNRLDQLVQSPFATTAQRDAVEEIDRLKITQETLLGELLMPNQRASWDSLTNVAAWRTTLMPEQPTTREKDAYFKLRDDKNMQNVYVYQLVTNARPRNLFQSHLVFVQGSLVADRAGQLAGNVYDPAIFQDTLRFIPMTYSDWDYSGIIKSNRTPECESFERIGLGELIDPNTGNYQKPILQLLDQLNRDDNSSSLFRAYVTLKLFALAELRPEEWAMQWCPDASRHLQALKDLGAPDLKSGDWMVRVPLAKYEAPFQKEFERARGVPLEKQASFLQQLAQETCQTDFTYAGFVDVDGHPVLRRINAPTPEYWGWSSSSDSAVLLYHKTGGAEALARIAEPLPFTPLFIFNGDRHRLLDEKTRAISYPAGQAAEILPPFFSGFYE